MLHDGDNKSSELNKMTNRELVNHAIRRDDLSPLELELALRLESFVLLHGDYMTEA